MRRYVMKLKQAAWLEAARVAGMLHGQLGTSIAVRFYRGVGMRLEGRPSFIAPNVWFDSSRGYSLISIGEGVTVSRDVRVLTHDWSPSSTFRALGRPPDAAPVGRLAPVSIGAHAFIGLGAILLPGATVGRGAIVGAGAVVRGEVPDYGVAVGNPATVVGDAREYVRGKFAREWAELTAP